MKLLVRARQAGLDVTLDRSGDLIIRGPKRLAALAEELLREAAAVREALLLHAGQGGLGSPMQIAVEPAITAALDLFAGATVTALRQPVRGPGKREGFSGNIEAWGVGPPCVLCGGVDYWLPPINGWCLCATCHPESPAARALRPCRSRGRS